MRRHEGHVVITIDRNHPGATDRCAVEPTDNAHRRIPEGAHADVGYATRHIDAIGSLVEPDNLTARVVVVRHSESQARG